MSVLGLNSKDRKSTRDKANISNPKVNRGCAPLTANRTSAECVQISLGPSIPSIPLGGLPYWGIQRYVWFDQLMPLERRMPKHVHKSTLSRMVLCIWYNLCRGVVGLETVMMLHFLALKRIPNCLNHCPLKSISFCRETWSSGLWIAWYVRQSSARRWHSIDGCWTDGRSLPSPIVFHSLWC